MAALRVTSKHLGFMVGLKTRFDIPYGRVYPHRWWWFRPRYEIRIPVDGRATLQDISTRSSILKVARNLNWNPHFDMELIDEEPQRHEWYGR